LPANGTERAYAVKVEKNMQPEYRLYGRRNGVFYWQAKRISVLGACRGKRDGDPHL
jgi:hypothetical protein